MSMVRTEGGFTLVELLIAMSITVMIAAVSYQFLDSAIEARERGDQLMQEIEQIERFWQLLNGDIEHIANRPLPMPATGVDPLQSVLGDTDERVVMLAVPHNAFSLEALSGRQGAMIWFSRHAWHNPMASPRSELQRVLYRLSPDGTLYRDSWQESNQALGTPPMQSMPLLQAVEQVSWRFLPVGVTTQGSSIDDAGWISGWPLAAAAGDNEILQRQRRLPAAIEVSLRVSGLGEVRRVFVLPMAFSAGGAST
ncbi:MAG: type II secretion system protein GspJ [Gammaproteobacteria bacterium]|nr:type II secretion system protein GspJ [Gammaproteobacteria bacterium]MBJ56522.1 type II secretion system protein GspJ [Gammaproteobacteria bacterium]